MIDGKLSKCYLWSEYSEFLLELTTLLTPTFQMMQCHDKNKDQFLLREQLLLLMMHSVLEYVKSCVKILTFSHLFQ